MPRHRWSDYTGWRRAAIVVLALTTATAAPIGAVAAGAATPGGVKEPAPARGARDDAADVLLTKVQALELAFPGCETALEIRFLLDEAAQARLREALRRDLGEKGFLVYLGLRDGRLDGFAVITNEIGKTEPITMLVAAEADGRIRRCAVMVYRESHGGEVRSRRFLAQFEGRTLADPIQVHRDVIHVSGATLSSVALCAGTRKVLTLLEQHFLHRDPAELLADARRLGAREIDLRETEAAPATARIEARRLVMGSELSVVALDGGTGAHASVQAALSAAEELDRVLSDWREESELSTANHVAATRPVKVSRPFAAFLAESESLWNATGGAFDPGIGELVRAWGFRGGPPNRPAPEHLAALVAGGGFAGVAFDRTAGTLAFTRPYVRLDPGAIGKGMAVDAAAAVLRERGIRNALVDFGSSCLAIGGGEDGAGWPVAIRDPRHADRTLEVVLLRDAALSTSGGYEKFVEIGGRRFSHLIDPRSGEPVSAAVSTSVISGTAARADALSTALAIAGPVEGARFLANWPATGGLYIAPDEEPRRLVAWPGRECATR
jgi:thiamine biosynthesis lipoprotein ApbE